MGMADNNLVCFILQSRSLDYPISLPFMPRHELNAERIKGEVQRVLQSNEQINLQDGLQVHLVHVDMPQGGVSSRKRKHYGFQLSKFLDSKHFVLRIKNKDSLSCPRFSNLYCSTRTPSLLEHQTTRAYAPRDPGTRLTQKRMCPHRFLHTSRSRQIPNSA